MMFISPKIFFFLLFFSPLFTLLLCVHLVSPVLYLLLHTTKKVKIVERKQEKITARRKNVILGPPLHLSLLIPTYCTDKLKNVSRVRLQ